jgi:hypothetical protein
MGKPSVRYVDTTQKQELDPIAQGYFWSGQLPEEKLASLRRINERVYGYAPGTLTPVAPEPVAEMEPTGGLSEQERRMLGLTVDSSPMEERRQEDWAQSHIDSVNRDRMDRDIVESGGFGYDPSTGNEMQAGGRDLSMRSGGMYANGGIVALANGGMIPPMMGGRMPNLSNRDMAYQMAMLAQGGYIEGPGTGTSDSIPATIYQDGTPVQEAALSDGEFVMTKKAVDGAGGPARMYDMMRRFEQGGKVR